MFNFMKNEFILIKNFFFCKNLGLNNLDLNAVHIICKKIAKHFSQKEKFLPDIIYTFGSKTGIVAHFISEEFENNPFCIIGSMEWVDDMEEPKNRLGFKLIKNKKWRLYIPESLFFNTDKKILIVDDISIGGDGIDSLISHLVSKNFDRQNIRTATIICNEVALSRKKEPNYYGLLLKHNDVIFPWGKAK